MNSSIKKVLLINDIIGNKSTIEMKQEQDEKGNKTYKQNRLHFKIRSAADRIC